MAGLSAYLTVAELLNAPLGTDLKSIAAPGATGPAGVASQQWYQALKDVIFRASSWIDSECQQTLAPSLETEELDTDGRRAGVDNNGYLFVQTANFPIISVASFQYGYPAIGGTSWNTPTLTDLIVRGSRLNDILYPGCFQQRNTPPLRVQLSYLSGYPNTTLTASVSAGATSLPLADLTGIVPSQRLTIYDQGNTEQVQVSASYVPTTGAGNLTLAAATAFGHTIISLPATAPTQPYEIAVSALGPDIKQAALLIVKQLVEKRGTTALVMGKTGGATPLMSPKPTSPLSDEVCRLLQPYKRIV